jgi:hypothetical protein
MGVSKLGFTPVLRYGIFFRWYNVLNRSGILFLLH